ncbi:MAG: dTDP-4-dehydrorhamnose reductase [Pseudomonadota bacterium]
MIVVVGQTGQVAQEIARICPEARFLSRADADLSTPEAAANVLKTTITEVNATAVINAAAYTAVDRAETEQGLAHRINAEAPGRCAEVCAAHRIPFVHISTDYVFDGSGAAPRAPDAPVAPLGAYGASKRDGERAVAAAGAVHAVLRTSWVFSAHGSNFVKTMLRLSETRDALSIVSDQIGGPTPASAIARACVTIATHLADAPALSGTYHFAGEPDVSWAGFARAIFDLAGRDVGVTEIPTSAYPTPAARPLNSRLDCSATEAAFGLLRPDWRAGLADVVAELSRGDT